MSGLRSSNSVINTVVDTLRIRGITEPGLLITSSTGLVSVGTAPTLTNLTVTGASILGSAVVLGPLTANSVNALVSLTTPNGSITNLDASNATINTLTSSLIEAETVNVSNAMITNGFVGFLDASNATITILDVSAASFRSLDVSNATITVLDASAALIRSLDASNATITVLDVSAASIRSLDASNATITILDVSAASISSLDASNATITVLDVSAASFRSLDASNATITTLDVSSASISSLDASNANIDILDASAASIRSLDASNATITVLDVSAATFNHLDASSASVSGRFAARYAYVGDKFQPDPSQNFVFINAVAGQTVANIRGSNLPTGSLQLGANSTHGDNIVLNADGTTDISHAYITTLDASSASVSGRFNANRAFIGDNTNTLDPSQNFVFINAPAGKDISYVRGPNRSNATLQLGSNIAHLNNIVLNANGSTTITLPLDISGVTTRYYYSDPSGVNYPSQPYISLLGATQTPTAISTLANSSFGILTPPEWYYYPQFNSFIQNFSVIQVNLFFDGYLTAGNYSWVKFRLNSSDSLTAVKTTLMMRPMPFVTPEPPYPVNISFILQKGINYTNNTNYLTFLIDSTATNADVTIGYANDTFYWELIGLI